MFPFTCLRANDTRSVSALGRDGDSEFIAGATDMLQLLKDGVRRPELLVDITRLSPRADIAVFG